VSAATNAQGNVNCPGSVYAAWYPMVDIVIDMVDGVYLARALGTDTTWPHGIDYYMYNVDADFNKDGRVDVYDLFRFGKNFGLVGD